MTKLVKELCIDIKAVEAVCPTSMCTKLMLRFVLFMCFLSNLKPAFGMDKKTENYIRHEKHVLDWIRQVPKDVIPYTEDGPLIVRHLLSINRLGNLDTDRQILELFGWQLITWTDVRLAWGLDGFIQVDEISVPIDMVWNPDIILFNSAEYPADFPKARAQVTRNGTVVIRVPIEHRSSCQMPSTIEEGDHMTCTLLLGSWNYDLRHMELQPIMDKAFLPFFTDVNRDWLLVRTNCSQVLFAGEGYADISTILYQIELEKKKHDD